MEVIDPMDHAPAPYFATSPLTHSGSASAHFQRSGTFEVM
jgi:hypothetical protein